MKKGLTYICGENPKILILGSLPGDTSIKKQQYYGHPQNHFWQIVGILFNEKAPVKYEERIAYLKEKKISVWDVLYSAQRDGSLDSNIKSPVPNDLRAFVKSHPTLELIILNGRKAQQYYERYFADISLPHCCVRSSSPVASQSCNTAPEKAVQWNNQINEFISFP